MKASDWAAKPLPFLLWWLGPIALAVLADQLTSGWRISAVAWSVAMAWMATGCLLNARRCRRRHCYLSGPTLLIAAVLLGLAAMGLVSFGTAGINVLLWGTFTLVLLTYVPELIWGRYVRGECE